MMEESEPTMASSYRNINYRVYDLGSIGEIAYIQIGDVWKEVVSFNDEYDDIQEEIEVAIDDAIDRAMEHDGPGNILDKYGDGIPDIDPDPSPIPDIDPDPSPINDEPYLPIPGDNVWMSDGSITDTLNMLVNGTKRLK